MVPRASTGVPSVTPTSIALQRNDADSAPGAATLPATSIRLPRLVDRLRFAYRAFQQGKFAESLGALMKKLIKFRTCRRRLHRGADAPGADLPALPAVPARMHCFV